MCGGWWEEDGVGLTGPNLRPAKGTNINLAAVSNFLRKCSPKGGLAWHPALCLQNAMKRDGAALSDIWPEIRKRLWRQPRRALLQRLFGSLGGLEMYRGVKTYFLAQRHGTLMGYFLNSSCVIWSPIWYSFYNLTQPCFSMKGFGILTFMLEEWSSVTLIKCFPN